MGLCPTFSQQSSFIYLHAGRHGMYYKQQSELYCVTSSVVSSAKALEPI